MTLKVGGEIYQLILEPKTPPMSKTPPLLRERRMFDILGFGKIMDSPPQAKFFWGKNELIEGESLP